MVRSMTGFGRGVTQTEHFQLTIEMRTVNHRFLEVASRFPKEWMEAEVATKKLIQSMISRGKIDVSVYVEESEHTSTKLTINWPLVEAYKEARTSLMEAVPLEKQWSMAELLQLDGALTVEKKDLPIDAIVRSVKEAAKEALRNVIAMREREGLELYRLLHNFKAQLADQLMMIRECALDAVSKYREKLLERIKETSHTTIVEDRVLTEVAIFAEKIDIAEELDRLESHLKQFEETIELDVSVGRKLDFLLQEIHRELNTIGSKNQSAHISIAVVEAKAILEKMREQVQNIE